MSNFAILTDSCCDLPQNIVSQLDITVLPLSFLIGGTTYQNYSDNREMSPQDFYARLRDGEMATTSAVNVGQYEEAFAALLEQGKDILVLAFTSALSTTYQSAVIAAGDLQEQYPHRKIKIVDTLCASMGQGLLVYLAAKKAQSGASLDEVYSWAEAHKLSISHQFTVDDLDFLKRGGRISTATAVVGTMLSVKPLLHVDEMGKLVSMGKARGRSAALKSLLSKLESTAQENIDTICISHGDCLDEITPLIASIQSRFPGAEIITGPIGPVIGAHAGPGTVAVFYLGTMR